MAEVTDSEANKAAANAFKEEGNAFLSQGRYAAAAEKYTEAVALFPTAVYYANRAQAQIKLESYGSAIQDANEAIKFVFNMFAVAVFIIYPCYRLDPAYIKAYYRRATCYFVLGRLKDALKDFKAVVKIVPRDPDAAKKLKECEKAVREEAFNKAIESEHTAEEIVDVDAIVVDASYTGPRLPDVAPGDTPNVTPEFVQELIAHYRDQKNLHRKYMIQLLNAAKNMFKNLPSLLRLPIAMGDKAVTDGPVNPHFTVCGDTHGQFFDLLNIFSIGGFPSESNPYLFNGDFVDRGSFSVENVVTLMAIKLSCPSAVHMLRGNHETK
jgi:serine/threonine-protein phosphatase 5